jgi:hypothetical protein
MLLSVSLRPDEVRFDFDGKRQIYPIIDTPSAFEIEYQHGRLAIEAHEQKLSLSWGPQEQPPPHMAITMGYWRRDDSLFYPEILIPVSGYVQISRAIH